MRKLLGLAASFLTCALLAAGAQEAKTYPAHVLIIRHAEKPEGDSPDLSPRGKERARALRNLFKKSESRPKKFPTPDFIFAAKDSKKSHRPRETVKPLAKRLELKVNDDYADEDFAKLAHELLHDPRYAGKTVLVSWHHGKIPELAAKLGADAPKHWNDKVFDRVWRIDYDKSGKARFRDLPQQLLAGDSEK
jgi:broad specificity phosphatase PhoE